MSTSIIDEIINHPYEERHIEFKKSTLWQEDEFKAKITKTALGMANMRDGGWIVIGKEERSDGTFEKVGMIQSDYDSYDSDDVKDFVKEYADPYVSLSIQKHVYDQKKFVVIRIQEFDNTPIICKRDWGGILHRGKMYTRSRGKPETVEVPSQTEMREIIDMAVDKEYRKFFERLSNVGLLRLVTVPSEPRDEELFDEQHEGIL